LYQKDTLRIKSIQNKLHPGAAPPLWLTGSQLKGLRAPEELRFKNWHTYCSL
jgi:hypothetical protein